MTTQVTTPASEIRLPGGTRKWFNEGIRRWSHAPNIRVNFRLIRDLPTILQRQECLVAGAEACRAALGILAERRGSDRDQYSGNRNKAGVGVS